MSPDCPAVALKLHLHPSTHLRCRSLWPRRGRELGDCRATGWLTRLVVAARGEQTASAMESKLSDLEQRIEDLLASLDAKSRNTKNAEVEHKEGRKD